MAKFKRDFNAIGGKITVETEENAMRITIGSGMSVKTVRIPKEMCEEFSKSVLWGNYNAETDGNLTDADIELSKSQLDAISQRFDDKIKKGVQPF